MGIWCKIFKHDFQEATVFSTTIVNNMEERKPVSHRADFIGKQCTKCRKRSLTKVEKYMTPSVGARQEAYDWLNEDLNYTVKQAIIQFAQDNK